MSNAERDLFTADIGVAESNQRKGKKVLAFMYALHKKKLRDAVITEQDLQNILNDANLATIERMLLNGSIETARALIVANASNYYTQADKNLILGVIDNEVFDNYLT